jgi:uncharacterized protein (UPF0333 family)
LAEVFCRAKTSYINKAGKLITMNQKAQASMEYMVLFGFSLLIVSIFWLNTSSNLEDAEWELQLAYAKNAVEKIIMASDIAYVQGPPAQAYVNADFPENINAVYIDNNTISIELKWKGFLRNVTGYGIANMTGSINPGPGRHKILVTAGANVSISEG